MRALLYGKLYAGCQFADEIRRVEVEMSITMWSATLSATIVSDLADGGWIHGSRFFYSARLVAALVVATLVPILIDRRLRR